MTMVSLMALFGLNVYPDLVHSRPNPAYSLSAYNSASSAGTLSTMLTIALIGVPLVLSYTVSIYWVFRGKCGSRRRVTEWGLRTGEFHAGRAIQLLYDGECPFCRREVDWLKAPWP